MSALAMEASPVVRMERVGAFVCGGPRSGFQVVDQPVHPAEIVVQGQVVRDLRVGLGKGLREGAKLAGLSAVELSNIELGRSRFLDFDAAMSALQAAWRAA